MKTSSPGPSRPKLISSFLSQHSGGMPSLQHSRFCSRARALCDWCNGSTKGIQALPAFSSTNIRQALTLHWKHFTNDDGGLAHLEGRETKMKPKQILSLWIFFPRSGQDNKPPALLPENKSRTGVCSPRDAPLASVFLSIRWQSRKKLKIYIYK